MKLNQTAAVRLGAGVLMTLAPVIAIVAVSDSYEAEVSAAQSTNRTSSGPPQADEYYPVKLDWIGADRSIVTIKHVPTASCYILVYPSGDVLTQVESERCAEAAPVER